MYVLRVCARHGDLGSVESHFLQVNAPERRVLLLAYLVPNKSRQVVFKF